MRSEASRREGGFAFLPKQAAPRFHSLPRQVRDIARLCDGHRDLGQICQESPLSRARTIEVLVRLRDLGLVTAEAEAWPAPKPSPPLPRAVDSGFSADEEAFFSRSIDHLIED
jgi:hypothetical protein